MEIEIQFARDGGNPELDKFHVHIRFFAALEFERRSARLRPKRRHRQHGGLRARVGGYAAARNVSLTLVQLAHSLVWLPMLKSARYAAMETGGSP
jgi:hypothetical protein